MLKKLLMRNIIASKPVSKELEPFMLKKLLMANIFACKPCDFRCLEACMLKKLIVGNIFASHLFLKKCMRFDLKNLKQGELLCKLRGFNL